MDNIRIIKDQISFEQIKEIAQERFGDMVKAVVDIEKKIMTIGGEMHYDEEQVLLGQGSKQDDLWGINIYLEPINGELIEFDSMINIRPKQGNRTRGVEDQNIQKRIKEIVANLVK